MKTCPGCRALMHDDTRRCAQCDRRFEGYGPDPTLVAAVAAALAVAAWLIFR